VRSLSRWTQRRALLVAIAVLTFAACTPKAPTTTTPKRTPTGIQTTPGVQVGMASWYGGKHHGGPTASGERFNKNDLTAAHRTLKMGTRVRVTRKKNQRSVIVRINDRGPYSKGRIIDLSEAAAKVLDMIDDGIAQVRLEVLK
jgi:rare lipoprotein A